MESTPISAGYATTISVLVNATDQDAGKLLFKLLNHPEESLRNHALQELLSHGQLEVLQHVVSRFNELPKDVLGKLPTEHPILSQALRHGFVSDDEQHHLNSVNLIEEMGDYESLPMLLTCLERPGNRQEVAQRLCLSLTNSLMNAIASFESHVPASLITVRSSFISALMKAIQRFRAHRKDSIIELFLNVFDTHHPGAFAMLIEIISNDNHPAHRSALTILRHSSNRRVLSNLLNSILQSVPREHIFHIISERTDLEFIETFLDSFEKLGDRVNCQAVIRRIDRLRWANLDSGVLGKLAPELQSVAIRLVLATSLAVDQKVMFLASVLDQCVATARRDAVTAISQLPGQDPTQLLLSCVSDADIEVRAAALGLIRGRKIVSAMQILMDHLDDENPRMQEVARQSLSDFSFKRFSATYDQLPETQRKSLGQAVLKIDLESLNILHEELVSPIRQVRLRAIRMSRTLGVADQVLPELFQHAGDDDHLIRREVIESLQQLPQPDWIFALVDESLQWSQRQQANVLSVMHFLTRFGLTAETRAAAIKSAELLSRKLIAG